MNWNREVSKNLEHTKIGIKDWRDTAERRHVLKQARRWARWQRDQLKSKEAIERAAKTIHETTQFPGPRPSWEEMKKTNPDYCTYRRDLVEETITALLGEG